MKIPLAAARPQTRPMPNPVVLAQLQQVEQLVKAQRYEDAAEKIDAILVRHPTDPYALFRGGWLCALRGHYEIGLEFMQQALRYGRCAWSEALNATGAILMRLGRYEEGYPFLTAALRAEPRNIEAWINLANWAEGMGDDDAALEIFTRAQRVPGNLGAPGIRWARSFILLKRGDYGRGWRDYETRWLNTEWVAARDRVFLEGSQFWYGEPLSADDRLLVHFEQGQGDSLMVLRYLPWLRSHTPARIIIEVQEALVPLLATMPQLYDELVGRGEDLPAYTWHVSLMSLPHIHGTMIETIPPPLKLAA